MKRTASCETFRKAARNTLPALPSIPERQISETEILSLEQTIEEILHEYLAPSTPLPYKNSFLEAFLRKVDNHTTQLLNNRYID